MKKKNLRKMCRSRKTIRTKSIYAYKHFSTSIANEIIWNVQNFNQQAINYWALETSVQQKDYYRFGDLLHLISCLSSYISYVPFFSFHFYFLSPPSSNWEVVEGDLINQVHSLRPCQKQHNQRNTSAKPREQQ